MAAAKDRPNTVIIAHLRQRRQQQEEQGEKGAGEGFFVACYHM